MAHPAQTPKRGGAHDAQGLLLRRVGKDSLPPDADHIVYVHGLEHHLQMRDDILLNKVLERSDQVDKVQYEYRAGMRMVTPI